MILFIPTKLVFFFLLTLDVGIKIYKLRHFVVGYLLWFLEEKKNKVSAHQIFYLAFRNFNGRNLVLVKLHSLKKTLSQFDVTR